jgi:hypothetical protein
VKGQISLEAILVIGMAVIVLVSFFSLNMERYVAARDIGEAGEARMTGELLATAINAGFANGDGFSVYVGPEKLNFTKLSSLGVTLPLSIDSASRTINIRKTQTGGGGMKEWNVSVEIIPTNVLRSDSTAKYPEVTIFNNGTHVIIYADEENIIVQ